MFLSTLTPKFYVALTGTSSLISGLILIFEWWYYRRYGMSFIEQVSLNHISPWLGGGEPPDSSTTSPPTVPECKVWRNPLNLFRGAEYLRFQTATTDLPSFSSTFLPSLLQRLEGLDDNQRQCLVGAFRAESDLPSFLSSLERLVTDTRYYQLVNASVEQPVRL